MTLGKLKYFLGNKISALTGEDKLFLKDVREEKYSVKLMYKGLDPSPAIDFAYRSVWNPVVPLGFFTWEATWGKVLTLDQLKRRGRAFANRLCVRRTRRP